MYLGDINMKKKILIGSIFAALLLLSMPFISTVNAQQEEATSTTMQICGTMQIYGENGDNPGGWLTTLGGYISIMWATFQPLKILLKAFVEVVNQITDFLLTFGNWETFYEFLQWV